MTFFKTSIHQTQKKVFLTKKNVDKNFANYFFYFFFKN